MLKLKEMTILFNKLMLIQVFSPLKLHVPGFLWCGQLVDS